MHWAPCLLVCAAVCLRQVPASPLRTFTKKANRAAPQDQVNILTYGVIQFRETLSHVYENTEAKIAQISRSVRSHEGSLQRLGKETEKAAEVERQIKEVLGRLQVQMAGLQAQTNVTKHRLTSVEQEEALLKTKVTDLEKYINNPLPTTIIELQERAELHSNILNSLQHLTGKQKQSLESHSHHLSRLQKMVQKGRHFRTHKKEQQLM